MYCPCPPQAATEAWRATSSCWPPKTNESIRAAVKDFLEEDGDLTGWQSPTAVAKYGPPGAWDVAGVTDFSNLFKDCKYFNEPIGAWQVRPHPLSALAPPLRYLGAPASSKLTPGCARRRRAPRRP